jgi:DNA-binding NtrC family response regulator
MAQILNKKPVGLTELNVLIIDDDNDDVMILKEFLEEAFIDKALNAHSVSSYKEALEALKKNNYDVCFVDYLLGAETGLELLEKIRSEGFKTPIVFITGQGDEHIAVNAIKSGAKEYLIKSELDTDLVKQTVMEIYGINVSGKVSTKKKDL